MKLFGLKFIHNTEKNISWKTILTRELTQHISSCIIIGIFGVIIALKDELDRTLFDKILGIFVVKCEPKLKLIKEFREYLKEKRRNE